MLALDKVIGPIKGFTVYPDHADRSRYHYIRERPRLALNDGVPEFIFLKYRRDITDNPDFDPETKDALGGAFMAFTTDLGATDEELEALKQELARFADGEIVLGPVQFRKGSVRLSLSKDAADLPGAPSEQPKGLDFIEEVYGSTKSSLIGFNRATFAVALNAEMATLFEAALRSGISPIGVLYDLEFLGMRPAFNVKVTADYRRIYDHLELQFGAKAQLQYVALAIDLEAAFQKLRDDGSIKVEVLHFTDDESLRKQADSAFDWFKTELVKEFFKSSLEPPSFMRKDGGGNGGMLGQLHSLLGELGKEQTGSSQTQLGSPSTKAPTPAPPPQQQSDGVVSPGEANKAAATGGTATTASGGQGLSPFQIGFSLKYYHQEELKTREFEYSMQAAVARDAAPNGMFSTIVHGLDLDRSIKSVSLDSDFMRRLVATVSMGGDLGAIGVNLAAVNLEYPGERKDTEDPTHTEGFLFKPDAMDPHVFTTWLDERKHLSYRYKLDVHFDPDSPWIGKDAHVGSDWVVTKARQLTLDPLDVVGLLDVQLSPGRLDPAQIDQVQCEVVYQDGNNNFEARKTFVLRPGDSGADWHVRLSDPDLRSYRYRLTYFLRDGVRHQMPWVDAADPSLVVNDPFQDAIRLRLVPLLDPAALVEADVDVSYAEPSGYERRVQTVFSGSSLASQTITIPTLAKDPVPLSYEITIVRADGSVYQSGKRTAAADTGVLAVSDGAGATHRVKVRLPDTNLAAAGLAAVKVDLRGPGDDPDTAEALFTPSQLADQTLTLVQPEEGGPFRYTYAITGYTSRGLPVTGDSGESGDPNLIVRLPSV
jgi:hypothetical protein